MKINIPKTKEKCDLCNTYKYCRGYYDYNHPLVICEDCRNKIKNKGIDCFKFILNSHIKYKQTTIDDFV